MGTEHQDDPFAGIEHELDGVTGAVTRVDKNAPIHMPAAETLQGGFTEKCRDCKGTGRFVSWHGRVLGPCFKCDGKGEINFKTSPDARAKSRASAAVKKANKEAEKANWRETHKDLIAWARKEAERFHQGKTDFDFVAKMVAAIDEWGSLTDPQFQGLVKCKAKSDERRAAWKAKEGRQDVAIDCSKIVAAFERRRAAAHDKGAVDVMKMKLHFPKFTFSPDRRNPGVLWVNSTTHTNPNNGFPAAFGKIENGTFSPFRICTPEITAEVQKVAANPSSASRMTGQNWGICCCCGATLTDPVSIEAGIGPICADNWGL